MKFGLREMLFVLLLIALPVAAYFYVFQPRSEQIEEARQQIRKKQVKLEQLERATADLADIGEEIDRLAEAIALFERKLPAQQEVEVILEEVWNLAAAHNLKPKSIRTDKIVNKNQYAELPINMVINGDFDGFYSFLLELEKLPRITQLPQMTLKKVDNEDEGVMSADVVLSIFFEGGSAQPRQRKAKS